MRASGIELATFRLVAIIAIILMCQLPNGPCLNISDIGIYFLKIYDVRNLFLYNHSVVFNTDFDVKLRFKL